MIEVIREGVDPGGKVYEAECNYCHAVFRFERRDAELVSDVREQLLKVACPTCKRDVWKAL